MTALAVVGLARSQDQGRRAIRQRWDARAGLAATFVDTYVDQLFSRETQVATSSLRGSVASFATDVQVLGFSNAVLLDDQGRVLAVYPSKPGLIGTAIAAKYPHLTAALAGERAVSPVVPAAADKQPVVGFAQPFDTPSGRRVFSGAYAVKSTPLSAYLKNMTTLSGARIYLVDATGSVLTGSAKTNVVQSLAQQEPALAKALSAGPHGRYGERYFSAHAVKGTPWTVVASTPMSSLLVSVSGPSHYMPWALLGFLVIAACLVQWLAFRRMDDHAQLRVAYEELDRLASLDALTGLLNRRSARDRLEAEHDHARRQGSWLSLLMIDVDHFKRINDTFGHGAGDVALKAVADRLQHALREQDLLGRWGGEEFLVVLPGTDPEHAREVAERLLAAVSQDLVELGTGGDAISVSVSIGAASATDSIPDTLLAAADKALYVAKDRGRDQVFALTP